MCMERVVRHRKLDRWSGVMERAAGILGREITCTKSEEVWCFKITL